MGDKGGISRRSFLGTSAGVVGMTIVPRHVLGGPNHIAPSDKINVGYIGTGTQGIRLLLDFIRKRELQVVSVCDVNRDSMDYPEWYVHELRNKIRKFLDEPRWGEGNKGCRAGRQVGKEIVETYYAKKRAAGKYKGCSAYADFRQLLEVEKDLDAVCIMTPEHLHGTIAIAAMKKGKHTITHKPLANVLTEVRLAAEIATQNKVATHMFCAASMHTTPLLCEWIWNGAIGQVLEVHNWSKRPFWPQGMTDYPKDTPLIPEGFNWDLWLGPAQYRPYNPAYTHTVFRGWYDFGTGPMGDMGHYSFYPIWKILKLGAPTSVEASRSEYWTIKHGHWHRNINTVSFPRAAMVHWEFPARDGMAPVTLHWYDGGLKPPIPRELEIDNRKMPDEGLLFVGVKGKILADFSGGSPRIIPEEKMQAFKRPPKTLPQPINELDQWIRACRGEEPADARFENIRNINESICLGSIALRVGKKLKWDDENMRITNDAEANKFLYRKYRKGWEL